MDQETLFEEIRTRLREAQVNCVTDPWRYEDEDLILAVRSAIRHLRSLKVSLALDMDSSGTFDSNPTETQGMLIALKVCSDLLRGDLSKKLSNGELGVSVRSVLDAYSTTEGATGLAKSAGQYQKDFETLLAIVLTDGADPASAVFGQQGTSFDSA